MRFAALPLLLCLCPAVQAAEESIVTDRPDFVESSDVVGAGRFQIETSIAWERSKRDGVTSKTRSTPTLLRIGLSDSWEFRIETEGSMSSKLSGPGFSESASGWADTALGFKWHQQDGDEASGKPGMGWLFHVDVDSGSSAFRGQGLRPSVRFVAEWDLPSGMSLGVMPGIFVERNDEGQRYTAALLSAVVGKQLAEKLRGFAELSARQIASKRNGGNVLTLDGGLAYLLSNDAQVDVAVSRGLNKNTPDWQWTVGLSLRY